MRRRRAGAKPRAAVARASVLGECVLAPFYGRGTIEPRTVGAKTLDGACKVRSASTLWVAWGAHTTQRA